MFIKIAIERLNRQETTNKNYKYTNTSKLQITSTKYKWRRLFSRSWPRRCL